MKVNSPKSMELAEAVFREHGSDWSKVRASGRVRPDGVIEIKRAKTLAGSDLAQLTPRHANPGK
jgi:hypothetical protein